MSFMDELRMPLIATKADFAEAMCSIFASVAFSFNSDISDYQSKSYKLAKIALKAAIADAYPDVPASDIYDIWVDCNESIAYCVEWYKNNKKAESDFTVTSAIDNISDFTDRGHSL